MNVDPGVAPEGATSPVIVTVAGVVQVLAVMRLVGIVSCTVAMPAHVTPLVVVAVTYWPAEQLPTAARAAAAPEASNVDVAKLQLSSVPEVV